ncbi:MAG: hypothetical protein LAQ30_13095 [Acidobacteriia bacterium]|nr:hypothetical protein [Terriglobia bacterium]
MSRHGCFRRVGAILLAAAVPPAGGGFGATGSVTQTVGAYVFPAARLSAPPSALLLRGADPFSSFQASFPVQYKVRTTPSGGGTITLQVTSDFAPAGGPAVASGALTYSCAGAAIGAPCPGVQTASTTMQTPVLRLPGSACTGGGSPCSVQDPNSVTLNFTLPDDPTYDAGSYSATLTFVISAT